MATHAAQTTTGTVRDREIARAEPARTGQRTDVKAAVLGGLVAGMIAGAAMAMVAMIRAWAVGMGFWLPPKLIAATHSSGVPA